MCVPDREQAYECEDEARIWITTKPNKSAKKLHLGFHNLSFDIPAPQAHSSLFCVVRDISRYPRSYFPHGCHILFIFYLIYISIYSDTSLTRKVMYATTSLSKVVCKKSGYLDVYLMYIYLYIKQHF